MLDKIGDFFTLLVVGAVAVHITTNKNSAGTIAAVYDGTAKDISAAVGS
jgi:hypothetical protein